MTEEQKKRRELIAEMQACMTAFKCVTDANEPDLLTAILITLVRRTKTHLKCSLRQSVQVNLKNLLRVQTDHDDNTDKN